MGLACVLPLSADDHLLGVAFYFITRDRPSDVGLPDYIEEDAVSATPESIDPALLKGFGPYKLLLSNTRFLMACHVKGLENIVRYGLTTWVPIYYFEEGGLSIESTVLLTILLPAGYLIAPPAAGIFSDRYLGSRRQPMILFSCAVSAAVLIGVAFAPPVNVTAGAALMFAGGLSMGLSSINSVAVDIAGRHMSGTATGIMSAHGYAYAGAQALIFAAVLDMAGSPWPIVFLAMAATRVLSAVMISRVNV